MCAPCKVIINERNDQSAKMATTLRTIALGAERWGDDGDDDDFLYDLALCEVEHIEGVRKMAVRMAKMKGAPERWLKLLERV